MDLIIIWKKGNSKEIKNFISHFERNNILNDQNKRGTPVCIWGTHGLGKTHLVRDFAWK